MAGELVRGIQSQGIVATVKHYALNGQEHNRHTANSLIGEGAARESDLLAFQIAIERGAPGAVMCGYNLVNGTHACENDWLLNRVLKGDWGYKGWVMSDWGATHGVEAINAGLDQQSGEELDAKVWFDAPLKAAVRSGKVPQARIDDAARRILRAMFAAGLFDGSRTRQPIDFAAHARVAQREAEEAIVLLQNRDGILPLAATARRIAVIGGHAEAGVPSGMGSSQVTTPYRADTSKPLTVVPIGGEGMMSVFGSVVFHPSSPLAALRARLKDATVTFDPGTYPSAAAAAAREADLAIVFVYQPSGEGEDVADMSLPFGQDQLVEAVAAANPHTVVVVESGNPVRVPWADKVSAIVEAWYAGSKGGEAIADVLTGRVNPSGRLPITWPVDETQLPRPAIPGWGRQPRDPVNVDYTIEGADVGYRWFARGRRTPRYWFGHGLSYTTFAYDALSIRPGKTPTAQVTVRNTGASAGDEVVQLYLTSRRGVPARRLLAFARVRLEPGEKRRVTLTIDPRLLADFDVGRQVWSIPAGDYGFAVGRDAGTMVVGADARLRQARLAP
jgi:beta-glucosidase